MYFKGCFLFSECAFRCSQRDKLVAPIKNGFFSRIIYLISLLPNLQMEDSTQICGEKCILSSKFSLPRLSQNLNKLLWQILTSSILPPIFIYHQLYCTNSEATNYHSLILERSAGLKWNSTIYVPHILVPNLLLKLILGPKGEKVHFSAHPKGVY